MRYSWKTNFCDLWRSITDRWCFTYSLNTVRKAYIKNSSLGIFPLIGFKTPKMTGREVEENGKSWTVEKLGIGKIQTGQIRRDHSIFSIQFFNQDHKGISSSIQWTVFQAVFLNVHIFLITSSLVGKNTFPLTFSYVSAFHTVYNILQK